MNEKEYSNKSIEAWRILAIILLVIGWIVVRLASELHHSNWKFAFPTFTILLSAIPASAGLLAVILGPNRHIQTSGFLFTFSSPIFLFIFLIGLTTAIEKYNFISNVIKGYENIFIFSIHIVISLIFLHKIIFRKNSNAI